MSIKCPEILNVYNYLRQVSICVRKRNYSWISTLEFDAWEVLLFACLVVRKHIGNVQLVRLSYVSIYSPDIVEFKHIFEIYAERLVGCSIAVRLFRGRSVQGRGVVHVHFECVLWRLPESFGNFSQRKKSSLINLTK